MSTIPVELKDEAIMDELRKISREHVRLIAFILTVGIILLQGVLIISNPVEPIYDQTFIGYSIAQGYPSFEGGISSYLLTGFINWLSNTDPVTLNSIIRLLVATLYTASAGLFSWSLLTRINAKWLYLPLILIVFLSGFPFLWLSTELLAGTFLFLSLWSILESRPFLLTFFFIALYSFAKPDLIISGVVLGLFVVLTQTGTVMQKFRWGLIAAGMMILFLLPIVLRSGIGALWDGNRSFISFSQHYASLVSWHQVGVAPEPWTHSDEYIRASFGDVHSVKQIILREPAKYVDFLFLSMSQSLRNMFATGFLITLSFSIFGFWRKRERFQGLILLVFGVSLLTITLFAYMHIRYQARFYPIMLVLALTAVPLTSKWQKILVLLGILALAGYLLLSMNTILACGYWFPD
jgi:hypothetical protein